MKNAVIKVNNKVVMSSTMFSDGSVRKINYNYDENKLLCSVSIRQYDSMGMEDEYSRLEAEYIYDIDGGLTTIYITEADGSYLEIRCREHINIYHTNYNNYLIDLPPQYVGVIALAMK